MRQKVLIFLFFLCFNQIIAQNLHWPIYASIYQENSFSIWILMDENEDPIGELRLRRPLNNDWSEWEYQLNDMQGIIKQKWKSDPTIWELIGNNETYTARLTYPGNFLSWDIEGNNRKRVTVFSKFNNVHDQWELKKSRIGTFKMNTIAQGDVRDWAIFESFDQDESPHFHMFLIFIVLYNSTPHF
jgi:hypothetical protein